MVGAGMLTWERQRSKLPLIGVRQHRFRPVPVPLGPCRQRCWACLQVYRRCSGRCLQWYVPAVVRACSGTWISVSSRASSGMISQSNLVRIQASDTVVQTLDAPGSGGDAVEAIADLLSIARLPPGHDPAQVTAWDRAGLLCCGGCSSDSRAGGGRHRPAGRGSHVRAGRGPVTAARGPVRLSLLARSFVRSCRM